MLIAAGCFISGNNFDKLALFAKFLGLGFISNATYYRMQTFYIIPEVKRYWSQMKSEIWDILCEESLVLAGDGRKAFEAIRNIVLDQRFLKSMSHYVTFR